ncbi:hypothetical protein R5R35_001464 [Gryllus longicercus]|uniref:Uncharacterized protein n=1 Tax=Gryllus longicercus TaxID=2509291 RepID=A0AAN9VK07_9ORTH
MQTKHSHGHPSVSNHFSSVAKSGRAEFRAEAPGERVPGRSDRPVARMHALPAARVALVGLWLALALVGGAAAQPPPGLRPDVLGLLAGLRPAKAVVRAVKADAPDLFVELEERVRGWGYPFEAHTVRTEDGYLLTAHRIPRGRGGGGGGGGGETNAVGDGVAGTGARPPVILQHGMMACSEYFVLGGPDMAPALRLADAGYDVWMTNVRGNQFSKRHETLGRRDRRFWMFSWHEMGVYDIPAFIDYILNATQQAKLFHVGHSMGNSVFYVAMSMRPEYNAKIRLHVSLSPSIFFDGMKTGPFAVAVAYKNYLESVFNALPTYELLSKSDSMIVMVHLLCSEKAYFNKICAVAFSWLVGNLDLNNTTHLCLLFSRTGSSTSALVLLHFAQTIETGEFRQMDHGEKENLRRYGSPRPPAYPLANVTAPVLIFASAGDAIVTLEGVDRLVKILPNVVETKVIREKFFNHIDFVYHQRLNELVTEPALEVMARF